MKEKIKNFETSDSSTRKDHLEHNNTNSKTEIQKVSNSGIENEDKKKSSKQRNKQKIVVTEDPILNDISEKGVAKSHKVTVENVTGGTSNTIVESLDEFSGENPDDPVVHIGTNDLTNNVKLLDNMKKIVQQDSIETTSTNLAFPSITLRKDKQKLDKGLPETKVYPKLFFYFYILLTTKI